MNTPNKNNDFTLTPQEIEDFHRKGYAGPFDLYDPEEMAVNLKKLRPKLFDLEKSVYKGVDGTSGVTNIANYDRHLDVDFLSEHICQRQIVDRITGIIGKDILCWRSEFFPKYPGDEGTDWHQAGTFSNVASANKPKVEWPEGAKHSGAITVWTAFTESNIENGCLQFIPGTHNTMFYDESQDMSYDADAINIKEKDGTRRGFFGYDYRQLQKDPNWRPDESKAVDLIMKPGQFMIFWSTLLHASHPYNRDSGPTRLGYSARYVPTEVKVYPGTDTIDEFGATASLEKYGSVLVSGEDKYQHNKLLETSTNNVKFDCRKWD